MALIKILLKKFFDTWTFDSYLKVIQNRVGEKYKKFNIKQMMSGILQESWLGEMVAGWDSVRKLNALEDCDLNWIVLLRDARNERNGSRNEILSFAFLLFL